MKNLYSAIFLACAAIFWGQTADATPPRVLSSDDTLIGATQTHLYVQRRVSDNRGSHYSELTDLRLVEIDFATGAATRDWLIRSLREDWLDDDGNLIVPGRVTERSPAQNMHAILSEKGAGISYFSPLFNEILWIGDTGDVLHPERGVVVSRKDVRAIAAAQILPMMDAYPGAADEAAYARADQIEPFALPTGDWACTLPRGRTVIHRGTRPALRVLKVACEDVADVGQFSFHLILPDALWD